MAAAMYLSGCARPITIHDPVEVPVIQYETVPIPDALLEHCQISLTSVETNQDLTEALAEAVLCNKKHNDDKDAIRALETE